MRMIDYAEARSSPLPGRAPRNGLNDEVSASVQDIIGRVRSGGDEAVYHFTRRFDGADVMDAAVTEEEFEKAYRLIDETFLASLRRAITAVRKFHERQISPESSVETSQGVTAWRVWRPIHRVGLYVPGGQAHYPSSVVMLGVPAVAAGCPEVILATPPDPDGHIPAPTLVAAAECGIDKIYRMGGAQAIAALAYGTESIQRVGKIFGPGNAFVTEAKVQCFPDVAIDGPAGPSELMILADHASDPAWLAADLLANAEHGPDSPIILVSTSRALLEGVMAVMAHMLVDLPRRELAEISMKDFGVAILVRSTEEALQIINDYAPEHLQLIGAESEALLERVENAGSIFIGPWSPNAAGDYATGTNHVLPTGGHAAAFPPLSTEQFGRWIQVQRLNSGGIESIAGDVAILARAEGLEGHARAVEARLTGSSRTVMEPKP